MRCLLCLEFIFRSTDVSYVEAINAPLTLVCLCQPAPTGPPLDLVTFRHLGHIQKQSLLLLREPCLLQCSCALWLQLPPGVLSH